MLIQIIIMSVSLSIDALGIGMSYAMKGIKIGILSKIMVGIVSGVIMWLTQMASEKMLEHFPKEVTGIIGTAILILIGIAFIRNALYGDGGSLCDMDRSKDINFMEAILLGFALSADCISVGIATTAMGLQTLYMPVCVGVTQLLFLWFGKCIGESPMLKGLFDSKKSGVFAGCILIFMGLLRSL